MSNVQPITEIIAASKDIDVGDVVRLASSRDFCMTVVKIKGGTVTCTWQNEDMDIQVADFDSRCLRMVEKRET
jgi:uncharacterized protein YodC (DUF2158 family)